jgi:ribA/ribD-fused uncharacterized protein
VKPYGFFCQWYLSPFTFNGQEVNCAEQFFMWKKAKHFGDEDSAWCILREKSPKKQKALGRAVRGFDEKEWDKGERLLASVRTREADEDFFSQGRSLRAGEHVEVHTMCDSMG